MALMNLGGPLGGLGSGVFAGHAQRLHMLPIMQQQQQMRLGQMQAGRENQRQYLEDLTGDIETAMELRNNLNQYNMPQFLDFLDLLQARYGRDVPPSLSRRYFTGDGGGPTPAAANAPGPARPQELQGPTPGGRTLGAEPQAPLQLPAGARVTPEARLKQLQAAQSAHDMQIGQFVGGSLEDTFAGVAQHLGYDGVVQLRRQAPEVFGAAHASFISQLLNMGYSHEEAVAATSAVLDQLESGISAAETAAGKKFEKVKERRLAASTFLGWLATMYGGRIAPTIGETISTIHESQRDKAMMLYNEFLALYDQEGDYNTAFQRLYDRHVGEMFAQHLEPWVESALAPYGPEARHMYDPDTGQHMVMVPSTTLAPGQGYAQERGFDIFPLAPPPPGQAAPGEEQSIGGVSANEEAETPESAGAMSAADRIRFKARLLGSVGQGEY